MQEDIFDTHLAMATAGTGITVEAPKQVLIPFYDIVKRTTSLAAGFYARVTDAGGSHAVLVSYALREGQPEYNVWCGDKFFEGSGLDPTEARKRCEDATEGLPRRDKLITALLENYNSLGATAGSCDFWKVYRRDKKLCSHAYAMLAQLKSAQPSFIQTLQQVYDQAVGAAAAAGPVGDTFSLEELAFRVPVLFEGDRGGGKTVTARQFARDVEAHRVELGGHEGLESPDMLGYLVPYAGGMVWKDGPLGEAFRMAQTRKVVLIIDEMLRIPMREQSIMLTAFSPDRGVYRLRTGRVLDVTDGVAREEVLECPVENLCIIATTNVGKEYAVDEIDAAVEERFVTLRKDTSLNELKRILTEIAKSRGLSKDVVTKCTTFFTKMVELRNRGMVRQTPTTRTLARALELAVSDSDVKRAIKTQLLLWVARTAEGKPVPEQVTDVEKIIERCFS